MKLGTENRSKVIAAIVLAVVALILLVRFILGDSTTTASSAAAPLTPTAGQRVSPRRTAGSKTARPMPPPSLDPTLRLDLLKESEETKYSGSARNIFVAAQEVIPKPIASANTDTKPQWQPPTPPPPPPILLKFYGFASKPGEPRRVFLAQDGDVFIAGEGDIVDRRYRILRISATSVEVEDVLNNNRQSIPLTQG